MMRYLVVIILMSLLFSKDLTFQRYDSTLGKNDSSKVRKLLILADSLIKKKENVKVYVDMKDIDSLEEVIDLNNWPEHEDINIIYNLIYRNGEIIMVKVIPSSESEDWYLEYDFLFEESGNTLATRSKFSFFNSICTEEAIRLQELVFYNDDVEPIDTLSSLEDINGKILDDNNCIINHGYEIEFWKNFSESPFSENEK